TRHHARSPNIRVRTMNGSATYVLSAVIKAEAEFGLNFIGVDEPEIDFEPLVRDPYVLICRKDDALAQHENVKWSQLATRVLISGWKGSGNRLTLDLALATHLPRLCWSYEVKRLSTIPNLVEGGLGIAVVPRLLIQESGHPTLACIPLVDPIVVRTIGLIHKHGRALSSPARQLYDLIAAAHAPAHTLAA
ncbi:MAG: LysR substrate-binding domain-containing protein, partial [Pseudomonadota bacterium]